MISGRGRGGRIRAPRRALVTQNTDFDTLWETLRSALVEIHTKNASQLSFETLYRASYKIVLKKDGDLLYDKVREFEEQWFATQVMPKIQEFITSNLLTIAVGGSSGSTANERRITGEKFLKGLKQAWEDHILCMNMTTDILMYMDRVYCSDRRKVSIFTAAMGLFRDHILRSKIPSSDGQEVILFDILNSVLLDHIQMEREGDVIDKNLIRSCIYMLEGLYETDDEAENEKLYQTVFEPEFLRASQVFYTKECQVLLRESDASSWLRQTQKRLVEEGDRCGTTISQMTDVKIAGVIESELISKPLLDFMGLEGSGIKAMLDNDRYEDLSLLFQHISRIDPQREALRNALQNRVVYFGSEINKAIQNSNGVAPVEPAEDGEKAGGDKPKVAPTAAAVQTASAIKWVDDVLQLKDKFDTMWRRCFKEELGVQSALTKSFSDFINAFPRCSEYVSLFIDDNLKRGIKGKTEAEVDVVLDKATTLLRYIQDKDLFERYYKKHLARRLLLGKSESTDVEKQMISRMKMEVGNYFTQKLEGMFKDMTMSEELTSGYRQHIQGLGDVDKKRIDLSVNVLTTLFWPMEAMGGARETDGSRSECLWPSEIKTLQDSFTKFYLKERNGRKLSWLAFTGTADLRCVFPKIPGKEGVLGRERRHELTVSTYGMIVLLQFNDLAPGASLSFEELQQNTAIPTTDLTRTLASLSIHPKARVLIKEPMSKMVKLGDRFSFNESFTSKAVKIKAPTITGVNKVEAEDERKDTESRNDEMRGGVIEAAVVRIMKQRKELPHSQLISEVISQLTGRFRPDLNMLKKRIESLIEREYLERIENADPPAYRYLA